MQKTLCSSQHWKKKTERDNDRDRERQMGEVGRGAGTETEAETQRSFLERLEKEGKGSLYFPEKRKQNH